MGRRVRVRPLKLAVAVGWLALVALPTWAQTPAPPKSVAEGGRIAKKWTGDLDGMIKRRVIRVLVAYNKTHYFIDRGVQRGVSYEGFTKFETELNLAHKSGKLRVQVVFVPVSREELLPALVDGRGDIVAGALTVTPEREKIVDFSEPVASDVSEIVVTGPKSPSVASLDDLSGLEVFVRSSSSYHESLLKLNERFKAEGKKPVVLKPAPETLEDEDLMEMLNAGLVKAIVVDDFMAEFWKQMLPNITLHKEVALRTGGQIAPAFRKGSPLLKAELDKFAKKNGLRTTFGNMMFQRYLKSTKFVKSATSEAHLQRFRAMIEIFRKYGERYDMDWLLMAAQGYQESGLDQEVKSPAGAIGVMQVMPATGRDMKVGDIAQLDANIHAGIKYMRFMINQYYKDEPMDRLNKGLFAFASYNAGPGRVRGLRQTAKARGLDPNLWFNNVERVAAEKIGRETVTYVSNIYKYYIAYKLTMEEMEERKRVLGS